MKIKRSYIQLMKFDNAGVGYLKNHTGKENKLCLSINSFGKQLVKHFEDYQDQRDNLQLDNCSVDEKTKVILKNDKGERQFTIEAEKKLKVELKALQVTVVECHTRIPEGIDSLIASLTDIEKEFFSGIVIPEQPKEDNEK